MTLEQWAFVAQVIGAVAVIASLIFVGFQLRQTSSAIRSASAQAGTGFARDLARSISADSEFARIWFVGLTDPKALNQEEWLRFVANAVSLFGMYENARIQWTKGRADEETWRQIERHAADMCHQPGLRLARKLRGHWYPPEFHAWLDALPVRENFDVLARE